MAESQSPNTDRMACVAAKWVPMNLRHPAHYSKSVCKHLWRKQIWLRGRSSQQTWDKTYRRSEKFIRLLSQLISLRNLRICRWTLNFNENICEITHDNVFQHQHIDCCFQSLPRLTTKQTWKAQNQWTFVRGIHRWLDCCVTKISQPVASYTILNTDGHIWTNLLYDGVT